MRAAPMHAILVTLGTDGDVLPYIGLGRVLRSRGHQITLVTSQNYGTLAAEQDLQFQALVSTEEIHELLANPNFWHPIKTARLSAKWAVRFIERQYVLLAKLARDERSVLVTTPAVFAASLVHEKVGTPLANILLQPGIIPSVLAPPVMPSFAFPQWTPRVVIRLFWRLLDAVGDLLVGRHLNPIRISLGLKPVRRIFRSWLSPQLILGMFPSWYGPPQADWPPQIRLTGFPMYEGGTETGMPPELLAFCQQGEPPIAFTFGTGMMHATNLFRSALEACASLGARGVFLTKYEHQLPSCLPYFVRHCPFAPFHQFFHLCAAVVHHGGIGTVAQALATGTPQLILPFAFDQMDNAARVQRLGAGVWLNGKRATGPQIAKELKGLMTSQAQERCRAAAALFDKTSAFQIAADHVEELARG